MPDDSVLDVADAEVAWTGREYRGSSRLTLTYPCLARARLLLWLVTGENKAAMMQRVLARDASIPAGRLPQNRASLFVDEAAARRAH